MNIGINGLFNPMRVHQQTRQKSKVSKSEVSRMFLGCGSIHITYIHIYIYIHIHIYIYIYIICVCV